MASDDPTKTGDRPDPNTADEQDSEARDREAQAEDPTSPQRGFEHGQYSDAEEESR
jgi:hypothetical protein